MEQKTFLFSMKGVPKLIREKAEVEINETPKNITQGIKGLKDMIKVNKTTHDVDFVDDFLLQFLRHRKFDVPSAFKRLLNFTNFRTNYAFLFGRVDIDTYLDSTSGKLVSILPRRCPEGCLIILIEIGKWNPEEISILELKKLFLTIICQSLRDPMTQINGFKIIYDFSNTSFKLLRYITPQNMYLLYHCGLECLPGRYKEIYLVNDTTAMKVGWAVFKVFAHPKLKSRVFLKSSSKDLLKHFPASVLPVQYGGVLTGYHMTDWLRDANEQQGQYGLGGQHNYYL